MTTCETEEVRLTQDGNRPVLVLSGSVRVEHAEELRRLSLSALADNGDIDVDWSGAEYVSAAALQVLLALEAALKESAHDFRVGQPSPAVETYLGLAGLSNHFSRAGRDA